jgi:gliding motility-associated-like protein
LNASGGDVYSWTPAASLTNNGIANPMAFPVTNTTYTVTIQETTCNETATLTTSVAVLPLPTITASKANDIDCSFDKSQLNATGGSQYAWLPAGTLSSATISNPVASPTATTVYIVKGTDLNGCEAFDSVTVNVENINKGGYLMPTAFTPNNDGLNDCYRIKFWGIVEELEFSIFNRWGERVFYTTDPNKCWDGTHKGVMQETAVFVYMIKAKTTCESNVFRKGTLLLIR